MELHTRDMVLISFIPADASLRVFLTHRLIRSDAIGSSFPPSFTKEDPYFKEATDLVPWLRSEIKNIPKKWRDNGNVIMLELFLKSVRGEKFSARV